MLNVLSVIYLVLLFCFLISYYFIIDYCVNIVFRPSIEKAEAVNGCAALGNV